MTAETDLLPLVGTLRALPEHVQGVVQAYARANVAHHTAALRAELDESCAVVGKLARLLAETAIVIKGPEPDMTKWSYHDIPDGVRAIQARAERLAEALAGLITWIPSADTYRRLGFDPATPMQVLREARALLRDQEEGLSND